nr:EOG090X0H1B [Macrothrix elegans]
MKKLGKWQQLALELFVESLLTKAVQITSARNAKTLSPAHLKQCILAESRFDFLKDLVLTIPDIQTEGEEASGVVSVPSTPTVQQHQPPVFRSLSEAGSSSTTSRSKTGGTGRPRGRPRKNPAAQPSATQTIQRNRISRKSDSDETDTEDDEDDDEDDSTDTDSLPKGPLSSKNGSDPASASIHQASFQFNAVQPNFYQEIGGQNNSSFQIQINLPSVPVAGSGNEQAERIRELNMQARQFANAVTAIQNNSHTRVNGVSGRSLQVTPWSSPRLLSPVDVRHIVSEVHDNARKKFSPITSPSHRWARHNSFKINRRVDFDVQGEVKMKELLEIWNEKKLEIIQKLQNPPTSLSEITLFDAECLVATLLSEDESLIAVSLSSIMNFAAFTANQNTFRSSGLLAVLPKLIFHYNNQIRHKACLVAGNMALNEQNNADLPAKDKAAAPDTMYAAVFGLSMVERYKKKALILSERHANEDIVLQARRLWTALSE